MFTYLLDVFSFVPCLHLCFCEVLFLFVVVFLPDFQLLCPSSAAFSSLLVMLDIQPSQFVTRLQTTFFIVLCRTSSGKAKQFHLLEGAVYLW